jgi:hypothetical protein
MFRGLFKKKLSLHGKEQKGAQNFRMRMYMIQAKIYGSFLILNLSNAVLNYINIPISDNYIGYN